MLELLFTALTKRSTEMKDPVVGVHVMCSSKWSSIYCLRLAVNIFTFVAISFFGMNFAAALESPHCGEKGGKADAKIDITMRKDRVVAAYNLTRDISCLPLVDAGTVRTSTWKILTPDVELSKDGNAIAFKRPQRFFEVELTSFRKDGQIDRTYTPIVMFGDRQAVAIYSKYLLPADYTKETTLSFNGFSPLTPEKGVRAQTQIAGNDPTYIVVGHPRLMQHGRTTIIVDRTMPDWLQRQVIASVKLGEENFARVAALPLSISYLLTYTGSDLPGSAWRGDTLHRLVRLNFIGSQWKEKNTAKIADVEHFVLHELFHTVNFRIRPATAGDGGLSLLEGSAEAAATTLMHQTHAISEATFTAIRDSALMRCLAIQGDTLESKEFADTHNAPYACGEALQYLAVVTLDDVDSSQTGMLSLWKEMLGRRKSAAYGWDEFFDVLRDHAKNESRDRESVLEDLVHSRTTWSKALASFEFSGGLRALTMDELHEPTKSAFYAQLALSQILDSHCRGQRGMTILGPVYILDAPSDSCVGVPDKFRVIALNGRALDMQGYDAYLEQARRCAIAQPQDINNDQGVHHLIDCTQPLNTIELFSFSRWAKSINPTKDQK